MISYTGTAKCPYRTSHSLSLIDNNFYEDPFDIFFRIGRMCRVGQKVNGQKHLLAISFFSPSSENQSWTKGQTPTIAKPSASERMVPFLMNEIFQFQKAEDLGDAAPFIQAYYNKGI